MPQQIWINEKELSVRVGERFPQLSRADILLAIEKLFNEVSVHLAKGSTVSLENFGILYARVSGKGWMVRFLPSRTLESRVPKLKMQLRRGRRAVAQNRMLGGDTTKLSRSDS